MDNIAIFNLNVRGGLRDSVKCKTLLDENLNKIIMFQETHLEQGDQEDFKDTLNKSWGEDKGRAFFSHNTHNSAGLVTIIPITECINYISHEEIFPGRILSVRIEMNGEEINILNLYNFTTSYFKQQVDIFNTLKSLSQEDTYIISGDSNSIMSLELDRKSPNNVPFYTRKSSEELNTVCEVLGVVDVWRVLNPELRKYTWRERRGRGVCFSRIDQIFISESLLNTVESCRITPAAFSDHSSINLNFVKLNTEEKKRSFWKFNNDLLLEEEYVKNIKNIINECRKNYLNPNNFQVTWACLKSEIRGESIRFDSYRKKNVN